MRQVFIYHICPYKLCLIRAELGPDYARSKNIVHGTKFSPKEFHQHVGQNDRFNQYTTLIASLTSENAAFIGFSLN